MAIGAVFLSTAPLKYEQIVELIYVEATPERKKESRESWGFVEVLMTILVLGLVNGLYLYFSFWLN